MAPDLDAILVDGDALLGLLEELDGWAVVAFYFENVS